MKKMSVLMMVLVVSFGLCASVRAAILFDDFNNDTGVLTGETANTGQAWATVSGRTSLDVGAQFGQSSVGAGNEIDNADWKANTIALGQVVNDGTIVLEADLKKQHRTNPLNEVDVALKSSTQNNKTTSLIWSADHLSIGGGWTFGAPDISVSPWPQTDIHATLTLTLNDGGTNSASISWYEIGNPGNNGSANGAATIDGTLNYDTLEILGYTAGTKITGFDNVSVSVVPEPTTIGLLLIGVAGMLRRR